MFKLKVSALFIICILLCSQFAFAAKNDPDDINDAFYDPTDTVTSHTPDIEPEEEKPKASPGTFAERRWEIPENPEVVNSPIIAPITDNNMVQDLSAGLLESSQAGFFTTNLFTGSAAYSYPISVPPGINQLQPIVSLNYNHQAISRRSPLGVAWSLNRDWIFRDTNGSLLDTSDDEYFLSLNGATNKLIYDSSDGFYHTQIESFSKIERISGGSNDLNEHWIVTTKDGMQYRFGFNTDSEFVSTEASFVSIWSIDLITDTYGNIIEYEYTESGYPYPERIIYNNGLNTIDFGYENVLTEIGTNGMYGYYYGTKIEQSFLLKDIFTMHDGSLVRNYDLSYQEIDFADFLTEITVIGSDGFSELPPVTFDYNLPEQGWEETDDFIIPDEAVFGDEEDNGVRIIDINGDGFDDIVQMNDSDVLTYRLHNTVDGWNSEQNITSFLEGGFSNEWRQELGVRFFDINSDAIVDIVKASNTSSAVQEIRLNEQDSWQFNSVNLPEDTYFINQQEGNWCAPDFCEYPYADKGLICEEGLCTRLCVKQSCSATGTVIFDSFSNTAPDWNDDDYDEEDEGVGFAPPPLSEKCYTFEFRGSDEEDANDDSACYDLYTDDDGEPGYDYDEDCFGNDIDAYAGIGFTGEYGSGSWLNTLPGVEDEYGWIGDVPNSYWADRYLFEYDSDLAPDTTGSNAGDWDGFNGLLCDEAGYYKVGCTPEPHVCEEWWSIERCGYGCAGEETRPFIVQGVYVDYFGDINDALFDFWVCGRDIDDNDYDGGNNHFRVTEYDLINLSSENHTCEYPEIYRDVGIRLGDVNGDGRVDLVKSTHDEKTVWINDGIDFIVSSDFVIPSGAEFVTEEGSDGGVRLVDVNGDGLADLIKGFGPTEDTWINTGNGWDYDSNWLLPSANVHFVYSGEVQGVTLVDVNGDGLVDILRDDGSSEYAYLNTGKGWSSQSSWNIPGDAKLLGVSTSISDVNGDGLVDLLYALAPFPKNTWLNKAERGFLLNKITNPSGGTTTIKYERITGLDNTGADDLTDLPFRGWVVSSVTQDNGLEGEQQVVTITNYSYVGGLFDAESKEFRGFNYVNETLADGTIVAHSYHQDMAKKGLEFETSLYSDVLYKKTENIFSDEEINGYHVVELQSSLNHIYDGYTIPKTVQVDMTYDLYGNLVTRDNLGDIDFIGDERYDTTTYIYDETKWIVNMPANITVENSNSTLRQAFNTYNEFGDIVQTERYLPSGNLIDLYSFDSRGNLINETNPRGYTTTYSYDSTHAVVESITDAKGFVTRYEMNLGTGSILSITDANNITVIYEYDVFGRRTKEILPFDSSTHPSKEYVYNFDGIAPEEVTVSRREESNTDNTFSQTTLYDGFNRQMETIIESIVHTNTFYDSLGRPIKTISPYFAGDEQTNTTVDYDPLGRVIITTQPDGSIITTEYNQWNSTIYNHNQRIDKRRDAYGNIVEVKEYNDADIYTTMYAYSVLGELLTITDNQQNVFSFTYDDLGRKIQMDDPDLGTWIYTYDENGNTQTQIDAIGNMITLEYDELDRIVSETAGPQTITYNYDAEELGTLYQIQTPTSTREFSYDDRYRVTQDSLSIDGIVFTTSFSYDSFDRIINQTNPDDSSILYTYDDQALLASIGIVNFTRNALGQTLTRLYANGLSTELSYDHPNSLLTHIETGSLQDLLYTFDNVSNIVEITDAVHSKLTTFAYDDLNRLIFSNRTGDYELSYTYDSIGNILTVNGNETITFTYEGSTPHAPSIMEVHLDTSEEILVLRNDADQKMAAFDSLGNLELVGICTLSTNCTTSSGLLVVQNELYESVAYIDSSGNLCIESGDCSDNSPSCEPTEDALIIENDQGERVAYIDFTGDLCLTGTLTQG